MTRFPLRVRLPGAVRPSFGRAPVALALDWEPCSGSDRCAHHASVKAEDDGFTDVHLSTQGYAGLKGVYWHVWHNVEQEGRTGEVPDEPGRGSHVNAKRAAEEAARAAGWR